MWNVFTKTSQSKQKNSCSAIQQNGLALSSQLVLYKRKVILTQVIANYLNKPVDGEEAYYRYIDWLVLMKQDWRVWTADCESIRGRRMEITQSNFDAVLPQVRKAIEECDFIACTHLTLISSHLISDTLRLKLE